MPGSDGSANARSARWAAARANVNRIEYLGRKIREILAASDEQRVRIASIGCGPAREVAALLGRTEASVAGLLRRGIKKLRELLHPEP